MYRLICYTHYDTWCRLVFVLKNIEQGVLAMMFIGLLRGGPAYDLVERSLK